MPGGGRNLIAVQMSHIKKFAFTILLSIALFLMAGVGWKADAAPMTANSADNKYTINYEWLASGGNKYFDFSIRNNDAQYNPGTSADDVYFSSAFGLNNGAPAAGWSG